MPSHLLSVPLRQQFGFLLLLGFATACISWTVTHEEIFREPKDFCKDRSENCTPLYLRKFSICLPANIASATMWRASAYC